MGFLREDKECTQTSDLTRRSLVAPGTRSSTYSPHDCVQICITPLQSPPRAHHARRPYCHPSPNLSSTSSKAPRNGVLSEKAGSRARAWSLGHGTVPKCKGDPGMTCPGGQCAYIHPFAPRTTIYCLCLKRNARGAHATLLPFGWPTGELYQAVCSARRTLMFSLQLQHQHMDDRLFDDLLRSLVVAGLDLR